MSQLFIKHIKYNQSKTGAESFKQTQTQNDNTLKQLVNRNKQTEFSTQFGETQQLTPKG